MSDEQEEYTQPEDEEIRYRGSASDPLFGLLLAGAVSIGLAPLTGTESFDLRYTLVWGMLALFGVLSWLIGSGPRIKQEYPENLVWGVVFALVLIVPLLGFGSATYAEASTLILQDMTIGTALAFMVFVMPLGETLFFRGILQEYYSFWQSALFCTIWQLVLFFPLINRGPFPLFIGATLLMSNLIYGYVRNRNGLAAAWICQISVNLGLIVLPFAL